MKNEGKKETGKNRMISKIIEKYICSKAIKQEIKKEKKIPHSSQSTHLNLFDIDTSNINYLGSIFDCRQATSIVLSNIDTSNIDYMGSIFERTQTTSIFLLNIEKNRRGMH